MSLKSIFKLSAFIFLALTYFTLFLPLYPLFWVNKEGMRKFMTKVCSFYASLCMKVFGVEIHLNREMPKGHFLIVSNHMSYMDPLIMAAFFPGCFITSTEMRDTPFLGHIAKLAGCVFVDRLKKNKIKNEQNEIADALAFETSVYLYPEATSTNGEEVKRFKRPMYQGAIDTKTPILPLTLNYTSLNGGPVDISNRDILCWYGDMTFFDHFVEFLSQDKIVATITVHDVVSPEEKDTSYLAGETHEIVKRSFRPLHCST